MRRFILIILLAVLTGCATSGYRESYSPCAEVSSLADVQSLKEGETPTIYESDNLDRDIQIMMSKGFVPIGSSSFNSWLEGQEGAVSQAKRIGALLVVIATTYTDTQANILPLFLPHNSTAYGSGSVYGAGRFSSYSGSSADDGTTTIPVANHQQRFDQQAVYFVKSTKKPKYGLGIKDLTPELRSSIRHKMGALIYLIVEDSPAFYANILPNDILVQIDGVDVRNMAHGVELMTSAPSRGESQLTILRNGKRKTITVQLEGGGR